MTRRRSSGARPGRPAAAAPGEDSNGTSGEYCSGTDTRSALARQAPSSTGRLDRRHQSSLGVRPTEQLSKIASGITGSFRRAMGGLLYTHYARPYTKFLTVPMASPPLDRRGWTAQVRHFPNRDRRRNSVTTLKSATGHVPRFFNSIDRLQ